MRAAVWLSVLALAAAAAPVAATATATAPASCGALPCGPPPWVCELPDCDPERMVQAVVTACHVGALAGPCGAPMPPERLLDVAVGALSVGTVAWTWGVEVLAEAQAWAGDAAGDVQGCFWTCLAVDTAEGCAREPAAHCTYPLLVEAAPIVFCEVGCTLQLTPVIGAAVGTALDAYAAGQSASSAVLHEPGGACAAATGFASGSLAGASSLATSPVRILDVRADGLHLPPPPIPDDPGRVGRAALALPLC